MANIVFEWDENKNLVNIKKHKVPSEEEKTVFYDEFAGVIPDPDHSHCEERFIILGYSNKLNALVVVHTYGKNYEIFRIISHRKTTKKETKKNREVQ